DEREERAPHATPEDRPPDLGLRDRHGLRHASAHSPSSASINRLRSLKPQFVTRLLLISRYGVPVTPSCSPSSRFAVTTSAWRSLRTQDRNSSVFRPRDRKSTRLNSS